MARAVGRPSGIRTCRAHCQRTRPHHWRSRSTQSGPRRLGVANESHKLPTISGFKLLIRCVLAAALPGFAGENPVLPRDGPNTRSPVVWRRRNILLRAPVHQTQHHLPAHAWAERHHPGVVGEPAAGCIPSVPPVGGWSRLGASSRPQIGRWDRRQCHMPDFWVTGRPRNPLNASVATFCAAGVISMHQTPPGMVRGVSGVSRGRFVTISTGSHSE